MIPILYPAAETEFTSFGIGTLPDAISCIVVEERNGEFELTMTYPANGIRANDLAVESIILAPSNDSATSLSKWQPFRIYSVTASLDGTLLISAEHISYQLRHIVAMPFSATSPADAMLGLSIHCVGDMPFSLATDKAGSGIYTQSIPASARYRLAGEDGSILDIYGGEYEWDRWAVHLLAARGSDNGVVVAYGKNLTALEQTTSIETALTGVVPYYLEEGDGGISRLLTLPERVISILGGTKYGRTIPLDLSNEFDQSPTDDQMRSRARAYLNASKITGPIVSLRAAFAPLWHTTEYSGITPLEHVGLCDIVTIRHPGLGISAKAKVVRTEFDVLAERYNAIDLGESRRGLDSTIADLWKRRQ